MRVFFVVSLLALPGLFMTQEAAAETRTYVDKHCSGCHSLEMKDHESPGIEARPNQKGPPLYYAGNKFRRDWLVQWLREPYRIRPAGYYPPAHVETATEGDRIDVDSLQPHPAVDGGMAESVADYLMTLRPFDELLEKVSYEPGNIAWRLGQMNFAKFNNCIACHQDEPDYGGLSGPELYTAWDRLQPSFLASYIADPVAWDRITLMPGSNLNDAAVKKLVDYLKAVAEYEQ